MESTLREVGIEQLVRARTGRTAAPAAASPALLEQIERYGPLIAIPVRRGSGGRYEVLAAESTWRACRQLHVDRVPVRVVENLDDDDVARIVAAERQADPISEAEAIAARLARLRRKRGRGAVAALARAIGRSTAYVSHAVRLLSLPEPVRRAIANGTLSVGHGKALLAVAGEEARCALALEAIERRWTVRRTETAARGRAAGEDADLARFERRLGELLGCHVEVDTRRGRLAIDYGTLEVLDGVLERLGYRESD